MAVLNILRYPDARLHKVAAPITVFDEALKKLVADMAETMYAAPGIGLAATQVDVHKQVIVVDVSERRDSLVVLSIPRSSRRRACQTSRKAASRCPASMSSWSAPSASRCAPTTRTASLHARGSGAAGGLHPARDGSPGGQGVRRVLVAAQAAAHPREARQAAAQDSLIAPSCASSLPARPSSPNGRWRGSWPRAMRLPSL